MEIAHSIDAKRKGHRLDSLTAPRRIESSILMQAKQLVKPRCSEAKRLQCWLERLSPHAIASFVQMQVVWHDLG